MLFRSYEFALNANAIRFLIFRHFASTPAPTACIALFIGITAVTARVLAKRLPAHSYLSLVRIQLSDNKNLKVISCPFLNHSEIIFINVDIGPLLCFPRTNWGQIPLHAVPEVWILPSGCRYFFSLCFMCNAEKLDA